MATSNMLSRKACYRKFSVVEKDFSKWKVLCVDDDATNRKIMQGMLVKIGFDRENLHLLEDGACVVLENFDFEPDLILLDIVMFRENGDLTCRRLRAQNFLKPIIAVTGNFRTSDTFVQAGFDTVLYKPFGKADLQRCILSLFD